MEWKIEFTPQARKNLDALDTTNATRILSFLHDRVKCLDDARQIGEPLKGSRFSGLWRYRVGDYRILCEIEDKEIIILVVMIGHRRQVYKKH